VGREDEIRLIAYHIWERDGCQDGGDWEHWFRAEAVWEEQQKPKVAAKSVRTVAKQPVKKNAKVKAAKKSGKT